MTPGVRAPGHAAFLAPLANGPAYGFAAAELLDRPRRRPSPRRREVSRASRPRSPTSGPSRRRRTRRRSCRRCTPRSASRRVRAGRRPRPSSTASALPNSPALPFATVPSARFFARPCAGRVAVPRRRRRRSSGRSRSACRRVALRRRRDSSTRRPRRSLGPGWTATGLRRHADRRERRPRLPVAFATHVRAVGVAAPRHRSGLPATSFDRFARTPRAAAFGSGRLLQRDAQHRRAVRLRADVRQDVGAEEDAGQGVVVLRARSGRTCGRGSGRRRASGPGTLRPTTSIWSSTMSVSIFSLSASPPPQSPMASMPVATIAGRPRRRPAAAAGRRRSASRTNWSYGRSRVERRRPPSRGSARRRRSPSRRRCRGRRTSRRSGRRRASAGPSARRRPATRAAGRPPSRTRRASRRATNASTSSGVGGRPVRSKVTRRMSVRRSAGGAGVEALRFELREDEAVDGGWPARPHRLTAGGGGSAHGLGTTSSRFAAPRPALVLRARAARGRTQRSRSATSRAASLPSGGIFRSPACADRLDEQALRRARRRTTAGPVSPPLRTASRLSRRSPPCDLGRRRGTCGTSRRAAAGRASRRTRRATRRGRRLRSAGARTKWNSAGA